MENKSIGQPQIGQRLRTIRQELQLSQQELGHKLAVSGGYLSLLENGLRQPSEQLLRLLCLTQGVNRRWLECGQGDKFSSREERGSVCGAALLPYNRQLMKLAAHLVTQVFSDSEQGYLTEAHIELILNCYEQLVIEERDNSASRETSG